MKLRPRFTLLATLFALSLSTASAIAVEKAKLRLAHNLTPEHTLAKTFVHFAGKVKEFSNGAMEVVIYPNGQMGETRDVIVMMQQGAVDMTKGFAGELESFEPAFFIFNVPYLFDDIDHLRRVLYGKIGEDLSAEAKNKGFFNLAAYATSPRSFYTNKPIKTPADLKGVKIRVMPTPTTNRMMELMGGSPVPVPWGETYTAIQQGVIDGAENNLTSFVSSRHFEVAKVFSEDKHTAVVDYLAFSNLTWNGLSNDQKEVLKKAAKASEEFQKTAYAGELEQARKTVLSNGVKIIEVDPAAFKQAVQPLVDELMKDPKKGGWIKRVREAANSK